MPISAKDKNNHDNISELMPFISKILAKNNVDK